MQYAELARIERISRVAFGCRVDDGAPKPLQRWTRWLFGLLLGAGRPALQPVRVKRGAR